MGVCFARLDRGLATGSNNTLGGGAACTFWRGETTWARLPNYRVIELPYVKNLDFTQAGLPVPFLMGNS